MVLGPKFCCAVLQDNRGGEKLVRNSWGVGGERSSKEMVMGWARVVFEMENHVGIKTFLCLKPCMYVHNNQQVSSSRLVSNNSSLSLKKKLKKPYFFWKKKRYGIV